ncbi:unnamed protein product [Peronospora belbahrii]|uniref:Uncharacterized protein n=1 Tax=Peronospora belbahrii TaxID=622444 RepID=A0ABN8CQQ6_9STRA|nr:unnamed protein product [Peronospora belbahrii]
MIDRLAEIKGKVSHAADHVTIDIKVGTFYIRLTATPTLASLQIIRLFCFWYLCSHGIDRPKNHEGSFFKDVKEMQMNLASINLACSKYWSLTKSSPCNFSPKSKACFEKVVLDPEIWSQ